MANDGLVIRRVDDDQRVITAQTKLSQLEADRRRMESRINELEKVLGRNPRSAVVKAKSEAMASYTEEDRAYANNLNAQAEELRDLRIDFEAIELAISKVLLDVSGNGALRRRVASEILDEVTPAHDAICVEMANALAELRRCIKADMAFKGQLYQAGVVHSETLRETRPVNAILTFDDFERGYEAWTNNLTAPRQAS